MVTYQKCLAEVLRVPTMYVFMKEENKLYQCHNQILIIMSSEIYIYTFVLLVCCDSHFYKLLLVKLLFC